MKLIGFFLHQHLMYIHLKIIKFQKIIIQNLCHIMVLRKKSESYIIHKLKNSKVKYCIGRIFSTTNANQKNYLVPDLKKIKNSKIT